ncbi:hypothetical protein [Sphingomonas sp. 35-24ZXX]|uniref:hypothetical protein n=1 Tax=Sphingomonas sp. 35-24ZXX TaxID=1545915 RepID=UPI000AF77C44|nr:hypothetical protein [Sphingomonas sp. 35-24ZXX]
MARKRRKFPHGHRLISSLGPAILAIPALAQAGPASAPAGPGELASLPRLAEVDPRFLSYNVEMVEVTGGRFWAPYGGPPDEMYRMRPPEDLTNRRLRALTRHLGPSYMRVSGTWANTTYLEAPGENLSAPPAGYRQVLTRAQWQGVLAFARAVNARIGTSFAVGDGTRGPDGVWRNDQAQRLIDLTRQSGGEIAFAEFINEPNAAGLGGLPKGYGVKDYTRDFALFLKWARKAAPDMRIIGPGGVGEGAGLDRIPVAVRENLLLTEKLMEASPGTLDGVSYHFYGAVSQRCKGSSIGIADKDSALEPSWLDLTLRDWRYYSGLRDRFEPGDDIWVTETAQAACGGSPWASTFLDSFRYVNQLGLLAQKGVKVVFHNTLAASDYALIDRDTHQPRPNYWAAVLWKRIMGTTVLKAPASPSVQVRLYAHCLTGTRGGVGLAALNIGEAHQSLDAPSGADVWTMTAEPIDSAQVKVNGKRPELAADGALAGLKPIRAKGSIALPARSITFIAVRGVRNAACKS